MKISDEISYDFDFRRPKILAEENMIAIENIQSIVMLSREAVTVHNGERYVTVIGKNFVIWEIYEGRITLAGEVKKIEFL